MPVEVSCPCGMRSRGPDSLAGKQAKCPQCGRVLNIPPLQQPTVLLTPLEPRQVAAPQQQPLQRPLQSPTPAANPVGQQPLGYAPLGPLNLGGLPAYDPLQRPIQAPKPAESGGIPSGVWIGLAFGAGGAVIAALVVIVVVSMSGGRPPVVPPDATGPLIVANVPPPQLVPAAPAAEVASAATTPVAPPPAVQGPSTPDYPMPAPAAGSSPATGSASPSEPPTSGAATGSASPATSPASTPTSSASPAVSPDMSSALLSTSPNDLSGSATGSSTSRTSAESPLQLLGPGVERWRNSPQSNLRGMQRFQDKLPLYGYSWMVELLPYLGHEKTYARFDLSKSWTEPKNLVMTSEVIPAFLNPADGRTRSKGYPISGMGLTHYVGMAGIEDARNVVAGELPRSDPRAGVFGYDEVARPEAITDGQSQTIMIIGSGNLAAPWVQGGGATVRGARAPYFDKLTGFGTKGLEGAGAQVMLADGSIRAISANIDPMVFKAMCTIHGSDSVDLQSVPFIPAEAK